MVSIYLLFFLCLCLGIPSCSLGDANKYNEKSKEQKGESPGQQSQPCSVLSPWKKGKDRRMAKVVAAVWGTDFIKFLATLAVLY